MKLQKNQCKTKLKTTLITKSACLCYFLQFQAGICTTAVNVANMTRSYWYEQDKKQVQLYIFINSDAL